MSDLAEYLHRHDLDSAMAGLQNVTTYTIGFGVDLALGDTTFLQATAQKGGGTYYPADNTATLQAALTDIVLEILETSTTYSTPTAPVNAFNRMQNLNDLYVSVFAPAVRAHWPGNLKKYKLVGGQLVDANGEPAVDPDTGFFTEESRSFWSDDVDGSRAQLGGAANELPASTSRKLYTNISGNDLAANGNAVKTTNSGITAAMLNAPDAERDNVLNWARGLDLNDEDDDGATDDVRHVMGDPLHVRPVTVIYGGTEAAPDTTLFVSTNDGYLHAVDADDGSELWAFIPTEMLGRLYDLYLNEPTSPRSYGLDGEITVYIANDDGEAGISGGEQVILLFGMRRGGNTLYAVDVTNRSSPTVLWKLSNASSGFADLGQTWSPPAVVDVNIDGTTYHAAIFGGGYDQNQDVSGYRTDTSGNAVYMVNALTGAKLWSAGKSTEHNLRLSAMTHSIPAGIRVLDIDQDKLADRMYAGDMGGRVWRFDLHNGKPVAEFADGGVLASLGAADLVSPALADVRRFYATPDVARIVSGKRTYLSINIGSGHREHPLDTATTDEFYALRDYKVYDVIATASYPDAIVREDLIDITSDLDPEIPYDAAGWRMGLDRSPGEKVLSEARTFANTVYFTSFSPGNSTDSCVPLAGLNRLYVVSVRDGSPITNLDGSTEGEGENLTVDDRFRELSQGGIAPDPTILFVADDDDTSGDVTCIGESCESTDTPICVALECFDPGFPNVPRRTHWNQTGAN
jgi:type IV pilus assembly protein PilY1